MNEPNLDFIDGGDGSSAYIFYIYRNSPLKIHDFIISKIFIRQMQKIITFRLDFNKILIMQLINKFCQINIFKSIVIRD